MTILGGGIDFLTDLGQISYIRKNCEPPRGNLSGGFSVRAASSKPIERIPLLTRPN